MSSRIVICDDAGLATAERAGVQALWPDFLLGGLGTLPCMIQQEPA